MTTKPALLAALGLATFIPGSLPAQTTLSTGHYDVNIVFESGALGLNVLDEEVNPGEQLDPATTTLRLGPTSAAAVPGNPAFSFLGAPGSPVYILPQGEDPSLLFLGLGAEDIAAADFTGPITLSLVSVSGPGRFSLYQTDQFGSPVVFMRTDDGVNPAADAQTVDAGGHDHYNWAFGAPGDYLLTFQASGDPDGAGPLGVITSDPTGFGFQVVPEPSTYALTLFAGGLGLAGIVHHRRRQRASARA